MKWLCVVLAACAPAVTTVEVSGGARPAWLDRGLVREGGFIFVAGQSAGKPSEQEAKDAALAAATMAFVKFAGVEVEAFDRSVETYSQVNDKNVQTLDAESRATVRAKAFVQNAEPNKWHVRQARKMRGSESLGDEFIAAVWLKVPDSELERVQKERATKLSLDIALYRAGKDKLEAMSEGDVLASGDAYGIFVQPSDGCHLYVYQTDAAGETFRLFPNPQLKTAANPIPGGKDLWIPNGEQLLTLDQTTGKERIYVFASLDKVPELENAVKLEDKQLSAVIKTMGVAGLTDKRAPHKTEPPKAASAVAEVKKKLVGQGNAFVYETWFTHR